MSVARGERTFMRVTHPLCPPSPRRAIAGWIVALAAMLLVCPRAGAETKIDVEVGWNNNFRPGRWSPMFVTATDDTQRQVVLELYAPHDRRYAMTIRQSFVIGPNPITVPIYAPLTYQLDETIFVLRDASTGKRL